MSLLRITWISLTLATVAMLPSGTQAGQIFTFDNAGDVTLSPTQTAGSWYTDRYAPAGFVSGQTGGNRSGVLAQSISESDSASKRPSGYSSTFYDTQGRKYDLQAGTVTLAIDLFVPSNSTGRLAGLWATAFDSNNAVSKYPIIEFAKTTSASSGTFRVWKDTAWEEVGGFTNENQWYRIGFSLVGNSLQYYVDNSLVFTDTSVNGSLGFGNVILQGHNAGSNYTIYWDNLSASAVAVPEPSTLVGGTMAAMLGLGLVWRRRRASAI